MVSEGKAASLCEAYLNGLNPCFSGGWSRRPIRRASMRIRKRRVLILVLVEDGLGEPLRVNKEEAKKMS